VALNPTYENLPNEIDAVYEELTEE